MPQRRSSIRNQTAASLGDGCLSIFAISPLAVGLISVLMAFFLPGGVSVILAAEQQYHPDALQAVASTLPIGFSPVFTAEVDYWSEDIVRWAGEAGLDPNLAATVMQIESCGDPQALSRSGAMGLFQVMPYHFASGEDAFLPDTNAVRGTDYLRRSLEQAGGDARLAFAGYNGGIRVIGWSESEWTAETVRYAYWGSGIYSEAVSGAPESLRLQEWLAAGGASLCRQAAERLGLSK